MSLIDSMQSYLAACEPLAHLACAKTPEGREGASITYTGMQIQKRFLNGGYLACHSFALHLHLYYSSENERKQAQQTVEQVLAFMQKAQTLPQLDDGQATAITAQKGALSWDDDNGLFALLEVQIALYALHQGPALEEGEWFVSTEQGYQALAKGVEAVRLEKDAVKTCYYDMYASLQRVDATEKKQAAITGAQLDDGALRTLLKSAQEHTSLTLVQVTGQWQQASAPAVRYLSGTSSIWRQSADASGICPFECKLWLAKGEAGTFSYTENEQGKREYRFSLPQEEIEQEGGSSHVNV